MTNVITFGNFKGGVGKTTASCITSYILNQKGYKVLLVDFDPQTNATNFMSVNYNLSLGKEYTSIYEALEQEELNKAIIPLDTGFDLIPSGGDLVNFNNLIRKKTQGLPANAEHFFLHAQLDDIKPNYDFVIIDTPPTISEFTNNALVTSDCALIIMQTQADSLLGATSYFNYIHDMINPTIEEMEQSLGINKITASGVVPYLQKKRSKLDKETLNKALSDDVVINDYVLSSHIYNHERIKRYRSEGITHKDQHDKKALKMYNDVVNELLEKVVV